MTLGKLLKIVAGLFIVFAFIVGITSINHPIVLKWVTGCARVIGKPIVATVYTNGQVNKGIKVYKVDKYWDDGPNTPDSAHTYLLSLKEFDKIGKLQFININLDQNWIGRPSGFAKDDYDYILGYLLQSDIGGHFTDFRDDMKGYDFDPQLNYDEGQIRFKVPPNTLTFDSIAIDLN